MDSYLNNGVWFSCLVLFIALLEAAHASCLTLVVLAHLVSDVPLVLYTSVQYLIYTNYIYIYGIVLVSCH